MPLISRVHCVESHAFWHSSSSAPVRRTKHDWRHDSFLFEPWSRALLQHWFSAAHICWQSSNADRHVSTHSAWHSSPHSSSESSSRDSQNVPQMRSCDSARSASAAVGVGTGCGAGASSTSPSPST